MRRTDLSVHPAVPGANEIAGLIEALQRSLRINAVVLFGSRARGDYLYESDWDIAVVSSEFDPDLPPFKRGEKMNLPRERGTCFEIVYLTPEEIEAMNHCLVLDLLEEGEILYDDGTFRAARDLFQERRNMGKIVRIPKGWKF